MKWFEIFKAGQHTDSLGVERTYTENDLDGIVSKYNPVNHEAPLVIGHPKSNLPAYGWVDKIKRVGDRILALPKQVVPEFEEMVEKGLFKKRSVSFYPDGSLRHIGFLGAMPPAIKGLKDVEFNADENEIIIEFSENYRINSIGRVFQNLRDWMIEKFGLDAADKVITQYSIDDLKQIMPEPVEAAPGFNENINEEEMKELEEKIKNLEIQIAEFTESAKAKDAEIITLKGKISGMEASQREADYNEFCEELIKKGKLLPANKSDIVHQLNAAHLSNLEIEFSENGEKKKTTAVESLKNLLRKMPTVINFEEVATKNKAGEADSNNLDAADLAKKAVEYKESEAKKGIEISFTEAVNHVNKAK